MKKAFNSLSITFITLLTFSCSSDKNETTSLPENKGDGLTSKYLNEKKEFDFKYENLLKKMLMVILKK